jgi:hypothetical protein
MRNTLFPLALACLTACSSLEQKVDPAFDAPEEPRRVAAFKDPASYPQALQIWRTPEDVNEWIGARFHYDMSRAMLASETQRSKSASLPIYEAQEFFAAPSGICVDLSRFTVETLRQLDPELKANYLVIEFSPVTVGGNTLRMHWLATFTRDGKHYFLGDSKRPGHIAGPYSSTQEFVAEYSAYRSRPVVSFGERESYQRIQRTMASKQSRGEHRP